MTGQWRQTEMINAGIGAAVALLLGGLGCGGGNSAAVAPVGGGGHSGADAGVGSVPTDAAVQLTCPAPATATDLCKTLPIGTVSACSGGDAGQPSQTGYLEILGSDGSKKYICAGSWIQGGAGGYTFGHPDQFMSDPQSCCGGSPTLVAAPITPPLANGGFFGALHPPSHIKPQESARPGAGELRQNPFAVIVRDSSGGAAFSAALKTWEGWAGDGNAHPAPDGSGAYYFPASVLINYAILETSDALPVVVIAPEVSQAADGSTPIGHPTLGGCAGGGGAPLALMAGEIHGTTLNNHSGRFGYDTSITPQALENASALFNCLGISITATQYVAP